MRPRDSQRSKVYRWEGQYHRPSQGKELSLAECEKLVADASAAFGRDSHPRIGDGRGASAARGSSWRITLPRWSRQPAVVLHECAHGLVDIVFGRDCAAHGPEFVAIMIELWDRFGVVRGPEARRTARAAKVRVASGEAAARTKPIPPRKLKRRQEIDATIATLKLRIAELEAERKTL